MSVDNKPVVVIIAYGECLKKIMTTLNLDAIKIACIVMADVDLNGELSVTFKGKKYNGMSYEYLPECLLTYSYDYIIVLGEEEVVINHLHMLGVPLSKIINLKIFRRPEYTGFSRLLVQAERSDEGYQAVVVGISYAMMGCNPEEMPFSTINLAGTSQDIFFNYLMLKKIFELSNDRWEGIRYAIIGIAPYSFHFDMSKSFENWNIFSYYPIFHDVHNYHISKQVIEKLFNHRYTRLYEQMRVRPNISINLNDPFGFKANNNHAIDVMAKLKSRVIANVWSHKRYPETVKENTRLFKEMLMYCHCHSIIPIVVGFPFSTAWNVFFDKALSKEFYEMLSEIKVQIPFYFLDFFNLQELTEKDFYNVDHVNFNGASKVTRKIVDFMCNL